MFEVGAKYEFQMIEPDGGTCTFGGTIDVYEHPLIKLTDYDMTKSPYSMLTGELPKGKPSIIPGRIINVTSPSFISAQKRAE